MRRVSLMMLLAGCLFGTAELPAQSPTAASANPAFEVASVKPNTSGSGSQSARSGKGSFQIINMPMRMLIVNAYGVRPERVVGGPGWIDSDRFDVNARAPENTPDSQLSVMLRTTLAERFKLMIRSEMREQPVYALVLARSDGRLGPNLKPSTDCVQEVRGGGPRSFGAGPGSPIASPQTGQFGCGVRSSSDGRGTVILGGARQLADLTRALEGIGDRVVIDRTGLAGTFDFELRFARTNLQSSGVDSDLPSVFTAVQEQLGLKLESQRGPVEFLVIESVEQPTPD